MGGVRKVEQVPVKVGVRLKTSEQDLSEERRRREPRRRWSSGDKHSVQRKPAKVQSEILLDRFKGQEESPRDILNVFVFQYVLVSYKALIWVLGTQKQTKQNSVHWNLHSGETGVVTNGHQVFTE